MNTRHDLSKAALEIWGRLIAALAEEIHDDGKVAYVTNCISGVFYPREQLFAILAFAVNEKLVLKKDAFPFTQRLTIAAEAINPPDYGNEPLWSRYGWELKSGSLAAVGLAAVCGKLIASQGEFPNLTVVNARILVYASEMMAAAKLAPGTYSHDVLKDSTNLPGVLNTTAMAAFVLSEVGSAEEFLQTSRVIRDGQRKDGFWPYQVCPVWQHRINWIISKVVSQNRFHGTACCKLIFREKDNNIYFGDILHHCLILYILRSIDTRGIGEAEHNILISERAGVEWILNQFIYGDSVAQLSYEAEPPLKRLRFSNFRETTSYFLILTCLPRWTEAGYLSLEGSASLEEGIISHISRNLFSKNYESLAIEPYECTRSEMKKIAPRAGESNSWKAALFSEYLLTRINSNED